MSSYVVGMKTYLNIKRLSYLLIKDRIGESYYKYQKLYTSKEQLKDFIDTGVFNLYKNNVASVAIQYGDKVRFTSVDFVNNVVNQDFIENSYKFDNYAVASLVDALDCVNYQIEIEYDKTFTNYIKELAADYLARKVIDYAECNEIPISRWGLEDFELRSGECL